MKTPTTSELLNDPEFFGAVRSACADLDRAGAERIRAGEDPFAVLRDVQTDALRVMAREIVRKLVELAVAEAIRDAKADASGDTPCTDEFAG